MSQGPVSRKKRAMNRERALYLVQKYRDQQIAESELEELRQWMREHADSNLITEAIEEDMLMTGQAEIINAELLEKMFGKVMSADRPIVQAPVRRMWTRWVAAASIIVVLGVGSYLVFFNKAGKPVGDKTEVAKVNDVPAPTGTKAMITLADGTKVYLDSVSNGTLATQGNIKVVKLANGQIAYQSANGEVLKEMKYNTLNNPRGSKVIDMQLSDGSHVWLNAGSSVTYPVAFIGSERKVTITGEAYFEVAHDASKPFVVSKNDVSVIVLGTHFNVNAYDDEDALRVTLLEGSVKVGGKKEVVIKPGEQAVVGDDIKVKKDVDVDEVMAWKNGKFYFNEADIQTIMRQVARWYDVDVVYQGGVPQGHFTGKPSRELTASEMLKIVEYSGVKIKIEGKKIVVTP
jgi:ferric-dicitrate binding protein FerR (iron transport regulator)